MRQPYVMIAVNNLRRPAGYALVLIAMLCGCGSSSRPTSPTSNLPGINLPAANTQLWIEQIQNQTLTATCPTATSCSPTNQVASIATDSRGDVIIGGSTLTEMPGASDFALNHNSFVAEYNSGGSLRWIKQFGPSTTSGFTQIFSIAVDAEGSIYVGGTVTGYFAGYTNSSSQIELMLVKLDFEGNILFAQQYDTSLLLFNITGGGITLLPSGKVAIGWLSASTTAGLGNQSFLYEVDPTTGEKVWDVSYVGANEFQKITSDEQGDIYAIGESLGPFPGEPYIPGTTTSPPALPFAVKLDGQSGDIVWQQTFQTELTTLQSSAELFSLDLDSAGDVIAGGAITTLGGDLCSGICDFPSVQNQSALIVKLNGQTGESLWLKSFSSGMGDGVTGIATDAEGNSFAVGFTNGLLSSTFAQPKQNLFALKLSLNGVPIWVQQYGTGPWESGLPPVIGIQAATDASGNLLVGGETQGAFSGAVNTSGLGEAFVAKFGP